MREASRFADLVEVRADAWRAGEDARSLMRPQPVPVIVTARRRRGIAERERVALLESVVRESPHFVDVEDDVAPPALRRLAGSGRALVSRHVASGTPRDLGAVLAALRRRAGPGVPVKLVTTARTLADAVTVRRALAATGSGDVVMFAMGGPGLVTRVMALSWGSRLTYGAVDAARRTAPGQPTVDELVGVYRVGELGRTPRLYGVAGREIAGSLSPALHNAVFASVGARARYCLLPARSFREVLAAADALGVMGMSVTAPFKGDALASASSASALARQVGAANTLLRRRDGWHAENTDVAGLLASLGGPAAVRGRDFVVLGAGGAARACVVALSTAGAHVTVAARDLGQARALSGLVPGIHLAAIGPSLGRIPVDVWINATASARSVVPAGMLQRGRAALDLAYGAARGTFLEEAARAGLSGEDGTRMLLHQGLAQARLFLRRPLTPRARRAAARALGLASPAATRTLTG